jgi:HprK-related kinase A
LLGTLMDFYPGSGSGAADTIHDFHIGLTRPRSFRRWWRPQVRFTLDISAPFEPYPLSHAFPLLEWGLNWCIAMRAHQYLMLHAGAVGREGRALLLPAMPGCGKSTLTAGLSLRGWRLLSDEFGLYDPLARSIAPLPRAIPLKNASIAAIQTFEPRAHLGPLFRKTRKGGVRHLRPPGDSLARQTEDAAPLWVVFPQYLAGQPTLLDPLDKSLAFTRLARNSFNYELLREQGFHALCDLIGRCDCYRLTYGRLESAISALDALCRA